MLYQSRPNPQWFGNIRNEDHTNWSDVNWLLSRYHLSFAEYRNKLNNNFGVLKFLNDDLIQPLRGFNDYDSSDMEIVTYVVDGELTHKNNINNVKSKIKLSRGSIQAITAGGNGITHSEFNKSNKPLRLIQMNFNTRTKNIKTEYNSAEGSFSSRMNVWQHLVSDNLKQDIKSDVKISADINILVTELDDKNISILFELNPNRQAYVLQLEGKCNYEINDDTIEDIVLDMYDAAELSNNIRINITSLNGPAMIMIIEMKHDEQASGRCDFEEFEEKMKAKAEEEKNQIPTIP